MFGGLACSGERGPGLSSPGPFSIRPARRDLPRRRRFTYPLPEAKDRWLLSFLPERVRVRWPKDPLRADGPRRRHKDELPDVLLFHSGYSVTSAAGPAG